MTATQGDLASLSRFVFRAPSWYSSLAFALCIAAVTGVAAFDSTFVLGDAWEGVFFIGLPTIAASVLTPYVDGWLGGQLTPNRASLLALTCELVTIAFLTVAGVVALVAGFGQEFVFDVLIAALGAIFALRLFVTVAVSRHSLPVAAIPASIQTAAAALLLFVYSGTLRYFEIGGPLTRSYLSRPQEAPPELLVVTPDDFVMLAGVCLLYAAAVWLFLLAIDQPWRRSLDVSVLDFIRGFIGHIAEGTRELEDFFEEIGEEAVVPVTVLVFRTTDGTEKARFVLPMIHPGPMGEIGGGNLPERVARNADGLAFPPHATAGHDFNLVTEREVGTIIDAAERAADGIKFEDEATVSVRTDEGEASLIGQAFGDDALVVTTYAPGFADDVAYAVGLSATAETRSAGLDDVMLVDAHNCNNGLEGEDLGHVTPGSKRSFDMIQGAGTLGDAVVEARRGRPKLGVAWDDTPWEPEEGIGPLGIRVSVLDVDGHRTAYVLVDGNNMEPGLRGKLVERVEENAGDIDETEVMTTDTHIVNTVEADNQVGAAIPDDELLAIVADLVDRAVDDLEPVEAGMASERAEVTVFGNDRTETLASHANAMVSMGSYLAAVFILAVFTVSVLLFFLA
jgi:putative membrane protein